MVSLSKRLWGEGIGTAWIVFVGCGSSVLDTRAVLQGYGGLEMSLAFGLALITASYAFGKTSGAHFNPAVTVGFTVAQRFPVKDLLPYIVAQTLGAIAAAALLVYIASGRPGFDLGASEFAANGFGAHSPADYQMHSALVVEFVLSFAFIIASLSIAGREKLASIAPLVVGACLTLAYHGFDSRYQWFDQSRPFHRSGAVRRQLGAGSTLAVLGCAIGGWHRCGRSVLLPERKLRFVTRCACGWSG